jgi:hypothetical protein
MLDARRTACEAFLVVVDARGAVVESFAALTSAAGLYGSGRGSRGVALIDAAGLAKAQRRFTDTRLAGSRHAYLPLEIAIDASGGRPRPI